MARWILVAALLLSISAALPSTDGAPPAEKPIQPGGPLGAPQFCTLNFVFTDAANTYIGTAAHCVSLNERVANSVGTFGTVVWREEGVTDFALIQIDANKLGFVSPVMRFWGGPTGTASTATAKLGDPLFLHGYGLGFSLTVATRPREGALLSYNGIEYRAETGAVPGDSGGPILDGQDGRALGVVSHFDLGAIPPATDEGPTVEHILARLSATGRPVSLSTAALAFP